MTFWQALQKVVTMELVIRKFGNSTGLTLPAALLRDMGLAVGQVMSLQQTEDGTLMLRVKPTRKKYTAKELNALCDFNAPMPADLEAWDKVKPVGNETL
jgi:antitoxin ChpS